MTPPRHGITQVPADGIVALEDLHISCQGGAGRPLRVVYIHQAGFAPKCEDGLVSRSDSMRLRCLSACLTAFRM